MKVLVIDVGGSHVKLLATGRRRRRRFESGPTLTPGDLVERVRELTSDWPHDVIALGYPGAVGPNRPEAEPGNLAEGWVGFDYERAFGKPVRIVNDAAMQAVGAYDGGRMLFLGLGTGLGSALVTDGVIVPLELGNLPFGRKTMFYYLGKRGLKRLGLDVWRTAVHETVHALRFATRADYVVLGGGNAKHVAPMPDGARRGHNNDAFTGGFRLWEEMVEPHDRLPSAAWRVVR